jgi:hypothetical protein
VDARARRRPGLLFLAISLPGAVQRFVWRVTPAVITALDEAPVIRQEADLNMVITGLRLEPSRVSNSVGVVGFANADSKAAVGKTRSRRPVGLAHTAIMPSEGQRTYYAG